LLIELSFLRHPSSRSIEAASYKRVEVDARSASSECPPHLQSRPDTRKRASTMCWL
jgi:hypothetical protein